MRSRSPPASASSATLNEGPEYVGTVEVDAAVRDRFDGAGVVMDFPPEAVEVRILMARARASTRTSPSGSCGSPTASVPSGTTTLLYPSHNVLQPTGAGRPSARSIALGRDPKAAIWATTKTRVHPRGLARACVRSSRRSSVPTRHRSDDLADDDEIDQMMAAHDL